MNAAVSPLAYEVVCDVSDHDAWLEHRRSGVGSSEVAILLGASDWGSNIEMYYRKVGELEQEVREQTEEMLLGQLFEPIARAEVARRAEVQLVPGPSLLLRSIEHPWALATPDAITTDGYPVEVKNLNWGYDDEEWAEGIPDKYFLQCQQHMLVMGAQLSLFGALIRGSQLLWEWIPRDEMAIRRIVRAGSEFWSHVERRDPPPSDGHPHARKVLGRRATDETSVELYADDVDHLINQHAKAKAKADAAKQAAKQAEKSERAARDALAQLLGQHRAGHTSDGYRFRWKKTKRAGFTVAPTEFETFDVIEPKG